MLKLWITLFLAILVPGGISPVVGNGGSGPPDGLAPTVKFLDQVPCYNLCTSDGCMDGDHLIRVEAGQEANTTDPIHQCDDENECDDHEDKCGPFKQEDLVAVADPAALRYIFRQYPDKEKLNSTRGAVQLLDCSGRVSVHLPVSGDVLRVLAGLKPYVRASEDTNWMAES